MVVIARLDLDTMDALMLSKLISLGIISIGQAMDAKAIRDMKPLYMHLWKVQVQQLKQVG